MQPLKIFLLFSSTLIITSVYSQIPTITILDSGRKTSLRGLSVVDDNIAWTCGSNGTVARSTNGGKTFDWLTIQGYDQRDFRDIEAFDANTALIMAVAEPAIILKTKDGGKTWKKVFEDTTKGMFLDAMDFAKDKIHGIVIGDPIKNHVFIALTKDEGDNWDILDTHINKYETSDSEAFFAASGTNVKLVWDHIIHMADGLYVSGGKKSSLFINDSSIELPIVQGKETTGANSIAIHDSAKAVIVGGDFGNDTTSKKNCVLVKFNYETKKVDFINPFTPPHGYRSCVEYLTESKLITCGTSGVDVSRDGGMNWELISTQSFHVCQRAKIGGKVLLAGANGKIALLSDF